MLTTTITISQQGHITIPEQVRNSFHWTEGMELVLEITETGISLSPKTINKKLSAKSLRGCLQHIGEPIPTEQLCKLVEYTNDSI